MLEMISINIRKIGGNHMCEGIMTSEVCKLFELELRGEDIRIDGLNLIGRPTSKSSVLSYATNGKYVKKIGEDNSIRALIVLSDNVDDYKSLMSQRKGCLILSSSPEKTFYQLHDYLYRLGDFYHSPVEKTYISSSAEIHPTAYIEDRVIIEDRVRVGAFSFIKSGSIVKHDSVIGNHTIIGAEGYQVLRIDGTPVKIKHCGGVLIEEYVEIGDQSTVCNTLFDGFTRIGSYTKIDSYCLIAHYANIGNRVIITPGVTIVGSVTIEDDCYIGAGSTIMNRVVIHKGATVGVGAVVLHSVKAGITVLGNPAIQVF